MYNITRKVEEIFSPYEFCLSKVINKKHIKILYMLYFELRRLPYKSNLFYIFFCGGVSYKTRFFSK